MAFRVCPKILIKNEKYLNKNLSPFCTDLLMGRHQKHLKRVTQYKGRVEWIIRA